MDKSVSKVDNILSLRSQLLFFCVTVALTTLFGVIRRKEFFALEESPLVLPITPEKIRAWGAQPSVVNVGLHILNFPEFDMEENEFVFDGVVWFEYDPAHVSTETIGKFSFEKGEILEKSAPDSKLIDDKILTLYKVKVKFTSNVDYTQFPLDDHRIYISFLNTFVNPSDIMFFSDVHNFIFSDDIYFVEWDDIDRYVQYGYEEAYLERHDEDKVVRNPKVVFAFDMKRTGIRQILLILIPLFLIFFTCLFSFGFLPDTHPTQVHYVAVAGVSSLIAYRFVLQNLSPQVGYFMIADYIFTIFLIFAFIVFFMSMYVSSQGKRNESTQIIRAILLVIFHILLVLLWYYLLFIWGR